MLFDVLQHCITNCGGVISTDISTWATLHMHNILCFQDSTELRYSWNGVELL
jgi:hypothetical protein